VERLQKALNAAGFAVPVTSVYDPATQRAVTRFQAAHGIPFPTGRQAGPKTLSTLDDHLLGGSAPPPKRDCDKYARGEREASLVTPGTATRGGAFGQELRLANFGAGRSRMKPEHEREIRRFIKEFDLFEPKADYEVELIRGSPTPSTARTRTPSSARNAPSTSSSS
jgi:peptidoglycan hydrolase-like protein with peptidoglycan-binding domain